MSDDYIHKSELEQFKLDLISKINRRFEEEDDKEKKNWRLHWTFPSTTT